MATKVTKIPMFRTQIYDRSTQKFILLDVYSHADYAGETKFEWNEEKQKSVRTDPVFIENLPWDDELTWDGYYRGRSAAGMTFKNAQGQQFTVFLTDFSAMVPVMEKGIVKGRFIYCKRGRNYGIKFYEGQ